jgi:uncharacterized membrane protein YedE/YeeE
MTAITQKPMMAADRPSIWTRLFRRELRAYANPYLGGILLGLVLFANFFLTGNGLGSSGGANRIIVWLEDLVAPYHVDTNAALAAVAGGVRDPLDNWVVYLTIGTAIGGFTSGWLHGRLKPEINKGPRVTARQRLMFAFIGGSLFGFGARLARGCTSGQALSGGATLSAGSWAVMFAIFGGAYGLAYFVRRLWN